MSSASSPNVSEEVEIVQIMNRDGYNPLKTKYKKQNPQIKMGYSISPASPPPFVSQIVGMVQNEWKWVQSSMNAVQTIDRIYYLEIKMGN